MHRQGMKFKAMVCSKIILVDTDVPLSTSQTLIKTMASSRFCVCSLNDIIVGTVRTGVEVQGMAEWKVTITNNCNCAQHKLTPSCEGFQSRETVDPNIFRNKATIASLSRAML
ncbi:hypothetical protein J1N35_003022 [Gossypium stocksii]|uniref:Uncharacterized protein n=1 Tax=Gossypium stocksii TaxID=47602 RepID=A0A9D4APC7_9ROSI|nr:hypothetical protein J1N35_003022 [Gossypium stocksii]